jgi:probable phosphoglycerate mutase
VTTFYLIRHAERDTVPDLLPGRAPGIRLTDRGRAQAEQVATHLKRARIDHIYSSPLERAVDTAAPLARERQLPVHPSPAFLELDFGSWTGRRASELAEDERWRHFNQFRSGTPTPGGESALDVQRRFVSELLRLRDAHSDQGIACFSHKDPIRLALVYFLGAPLDSFERFEIDFASVSELQLASWGARVVKLNEVPRP